MILSLYLKELFILGLLSLSISSQGYGFKDPTSGSSSSLLGFGGSVNSGQAMGAQMRSNGNAQGMMPVSRSKSNQGSQGNSGYNNLSSVINTNQRNVQTVQGGDSSNSLSKMMNLVNSNPKLLNIWKQAQGSNNQSTKNSVMDLLMTFLGGSNSGGGSPAAAPQSPTVAHCSAPKYMTIMNAVKAIPKKLELQFKQTDQTKITFIYIKKNEETNFINYKLVFKYESGQKKVFSYFKLNIPRMAGSDPKIETFFTSSKPTLMSTIVNETDFGLNNVIKCIDLKIMFNGGLGQNIPPSSFGGSQPGSSMMPGRYGAHQAMNPMMQNQAMNPMMMQNQGMNALLMQSMGVNPMMMQNIGMNQMRAPASSPYGFGQAAGGSGGTFMNAGAR